MIALKQSTAVTVKVGPFVDDSDGNTAETALTIAQADVRLAKNGGNMAQKNEATALAHDEIGIYDCLLNATDTNTLGVLTLTIHESGALHVHQEYMVLPANVWDSLYGADRLQVDLTQCGGSAVAAGAIPNAAADGVGGLPVSDAGGLDMDALAVNQANIEADTQDLQTQIGTAGAGLADLGGMSTAMKAEINAEADTALADYDPPTKAEMDTAHALLATEAKQDVIDGIVDAILVDTGTTLPAEHAALNDPTAAAIADAVWDEAASGHVTAGTFGQRMAAIRSGTAQAGAAGTITLDASANAGDDFYNNCILVVTAGTGVGQARVIDDYTGASKVASVNDNWVTNPDATSVFVIIPFGSIPGASAPTAAQVADAVWDEAASGHVTAGTFGQRMAAIRSGTAQAGAAGTITLDASANANDDFYNNCILVVTAGTGVGQARVIDDYTGASKVASVNDNWITNPDATSVFVIVPFGSIPGASAPTAAQVADAVWDEARSGHVGAGSFGEGVLAESLNTQAKADVNAEADTALADYDPPTKAEMDTAHALLATEAKQDVIDGIVDAILVDTGTTLPAEHAALNDPTAASIADAVWDEARAGHVGAGSFGGGVLAESLNTQAKADVNAEVDTALSDYDPATKAEMDTAHALLATEAKQDVIDGIVDAILVDTGTTLPAEHAAIEADTQDLQSRLPAALVTGRMDADVGAMQAGVVAAAAIGADAITAAKIADDAIGADQLSAAAVQEIADGLLDRTDGVEPGSAGTERTVREAMRLMLAALCGKLSGAATASIAVRDTNDSTDRIAATVDADGNRTAITLIDS